jgi:hypothetical protein
MRQTMSAFRGKADTAETASDVPFWPKADIGLPYRYAHQQRFCHSPGGYTGCANLR